MRKFMQKSPVVFEIILFILALLLAAVLMAVLSTVFTDANVSGSVARIVVGLLLFLIFIRAFRLRKFFSGLVMMLPVLLLAIYKIPYHFISGGGAVNPITLSLILIGLAPAVFEEILFRGIFIANLKKKYNSSLLIVLISALVFALVHLTNLVGMDLTAVGIQLIMAMTVGIVLGAIYMYTGDLISVIIAHFAIDELGQIFPGGNSTPAYFLAIFAAMLLFEIVYGLLIVRKIPAK